MCEPLESKVERFIEFNQLMIETAVRRENLQHQGVHAKVLLCSILDSLGKSRFPDINRNGQRFISLLDECSEWEEKDNISLLHLTRAFEVEPHDNQVFYDANEWASEQMRHHFNLSDRLLSVHVPIATDPQMNLVLEHWPMTSCVIPQRLGGLSLEKVQHKNLLWLYRNSLVHEFRLPGRGAELHGAGESAAYYQQVSEIQGINEEVGLQFSNRWEWIYPTGFFRSLTERILLRVAEFHLSNGTSPFAAYSEGSFWIPAYNDEL